MNKTIIISIMLISTAFLTACSPDAPRIDIEFNNFELGDVVNGTIISKDITIENIGGAPLIIEEVSTSCGCTTAVVDQTSISPGGKTILRVEFDSGAHGPELTGMLMRQVFLKTNDPSSPEVMVEFTANIVK
jgi:hypothetical protein